MKKKILFLGLLSFSIITTAQIKIGGESEIRKLVSNAKEFNFIRDWGKTAEFKSGVGEYVRFFPLEYTEIATGQKVKALQLDLMVKDEGGNAKEGQPISKKGEIVRSIWLDVFEVKKFIIFLEKNVLPNLEVKYKNKSSEYIFKSKEMIFSYFINEKTKRITIYAVDFGPSGADAGGTLIEFWTESQVDKIDELVPVLKEIF